MQGGNVDLSEGEMADVSKDVKLTRLLYQNFYNGLNKQIVDFGCKN